LTRADDTSYIFQRIANRAVKAGITNNFTKESISWFRSTAFNISSVSAPKLMNDKKNVKNKLTPNDIGRMFMYFYDPKLKEELPYYDKFPLIFLVDFTQDGFYGINLHYLAPVLRAKLMDSLYTLRNNNKYDDTTKLKLTYQILKNASRFKYFAPCFKRYLYGHVQGGQYLNVEIQNWDKALMLPTERFAKATKERVQRASYLSVMD
jgi:hypothetical protein